MTERVEPWSTTMIAWLRRSTPEHLEPHTLTQLADIARDHARLVADLEAHRSLSRNQIEQWQHERDALRAKLVEQKQRLTNQSESIRLAREERDALNPQAFEALEDKLAEQERELAVLRSGLEQCETSLRAVAVHSVQLSMAADAREVLERLEAARTNR